MKLRTKLISLLLSFFMLFSIAGIAGHQSWMSWKKGADISAGTTFSLGDPEYGSVTPVSAIYTSHFKVRFRYDQKKYSVLENFSSTVNYTVTLYKASGTAVSQNGSLNINFSVHDAEHHKDIHEKKYVSNTASDPYVRAEIKVNGIAYQNGSGTTIPAVDEVYLDLVYNVDRYYDMSLTELPIVNHEFTSNTDSKNEKNELLLSWNQVVGAENYDIEWVYVNTGDLTQSNLTAAQIPVDFSQSVRVNVSDNTYRISLTYPEGYLFYRVRAVGPDFGVLTSNNKLKWVNGRWSNYSISNISNLNLSQAMGYSNSDSNPNHIKVNGFEKTLNWTYSAAYAEEGKYVENVAFFDGSQRNRQGVASMNSDKTKVVSESKYDYEGRPAVNILPIPVESQGLKFYRGSGNAEFNGSFDRTNFSMDGHLNLKDPLNNLSDALPAASEVNKYYSAANSLNRPFIEYTPDAQGFPYTQVVYDNDGTNRVLAQSGVGKTFHVKSEYSTRNYYVNPTQEELNRLFGNEVGFVEHYKKVIGEDPNGQLSVSYLNSGNKTIASALMGVTPENLIDADDKDPETIITSDLLQNGSDKLSNGTYVKRHTFFVNLGSNPTINYGLQPIQYNDNCHPNAPFNIKYDVMLYVENDEGTVQHSIVTSGGNPVKQYKTNLSSTTESLSVSATPMGVRRVAKSLKVNDAAFQNQYDALKNKLYADLDSVKNDYTNQLQNILSGVSSGLTASTYSTCIPFPMPQMEPCFNSCEDECENIYKETSQSGTVTYYDENFNEDNDPGHPAYHAAVTKCKETCSDTGKTAVIDSPCEQQLKTLKIQMSPGGTYFDNLPAKYLINDSTGVAMNTVGERIVNPSYATGLINVWLQSNLTFATVKAALIAEFGTSVSTINSWNDLRNNWISAYANVLVKYHPEYCQYEFYCTMNDTLCCHKAPPGERCQCEIIMDMSEVNDYELRMTGILNNDSAILTVSGNQYNHFLPVPMAGLTTTSAGITGNNFSYFHDFNGNTTTGVTYDPLANSAHYVNYILGKLKYFINSGSNRYSLWYVLKNPDGINSTTTGVPTQIKSIFDKFHNPTTGIIATGKVSAIQMFVSTYNFYRKKYIYDILKANYPSICGQPTPYFNGDTDYNNYVNNATPTIDDDFPLVYPRHYQYDNWTAFSNPATSMNVSSQLMKYQMKDNCVASAHRWITELKQNGCLSGLSVSAIGLLRAKLIEVCSNGGEDNIQNFISAPPLTPQAQLDDWNWKGMFGSDSCQTSVSITYSGSTTSATNFTQVLAAFGLTGPSCIVHHPANDASAVQPESNCHWGQLQTLVGSTYDKDDPANPTAYATTVVNWLNTNSYGTYTVDQVKRWIKYFTGNPTGTLLPSVGEPEFPHVFECGDCKCDKLQTFIEELGYTYTSLSSTDRADIAADMNANMDLTGAAALTGADILAWVNQCAATGTVPPGAFNKLPAIFRCLGDNGMFDPMSLHKACLINSFYTALANSEVAYRDKIEGKLEKFKTDYYAKAFDSLNAREMMTLTYRLNEYYYTLYYYDQAGNLTKTVPPKGVVPLNLTTYNTAINNYRKGTSSTMIHPSHKMITNYRYNSFNQPYHHQTPDGGKTEFWYDELERIVVSQNARQAVTVGGKTRFSYTTYDALGRTKEAGQVASATGMASSTSYNPAVLNAWFTPIVSSKTEITTTLYDDVASNVPSGLTQLNLRNRVSASYHFQNNTKLLANDYETGTFYSYDIHGNVKELMQSLPMITRAGRINRKVQYDYDLLSGNVNKVSYSPGTKDQFYHRYFYDDNNRLTVAETSRDNEIWEKESKYFYYPHGPLARVEMGDKQVQAKDYAYSLQGWMKGVNASTLNRKRDIGKDALYKDGAHNLHTLIAEDEVGFTLNYFDRAKVPGLTTFSSLLKDYTPIKAGMTGYNASDDFEAMASASDAYHSGVHDMSNGLNTSGVTSLASLNTKKVYAPLYNGNISRMVVAMSGLGETPLQVHNNVYRYDQLNRIKSMNVFKVAGSDKIAINNNFQDAVNGFDYHTQYEYDRNGNIMKLMRHAYQKGSINRDMDFFDYKYNGEDNKLRVVNDSIPTTTNWGSDIEDQMGTTAFNATNLVTHNYEYDKSGNLIKDKAEEIDRIDWTISGKVKRIIRKSNSSKSDLEFFYDPLGNRIAKLVKPRTGTGLNSEYHWKYTYYVRDASGNTLANYTRDFNAPGCRVTVDLNSLTMEAGETVSSIQLKNVSYPIILSGTTLVQTIIDKINSVTGYQAVSNGKSGFVADYIGGEDCSTKRLVITTNLRSYLFQFQSSGPAVEKFKLASHDIYGSDRLGVDQKAIVLDQNTFTASIHSTTKQFTNYQITSVYNPVLAPGERWLGYRRYELKNHLGNVLSVVSDRRICEDKILFENDFSSDFLPFFAAQTFTLESGKLKVFTSSNTQGAWFTYHGGDMGKSYSVDFDFTNGNTSSYNLVVHTIPYDPTQAQYFAMDEGANSINFVSKSNDFLIGIQRTTASGPLQHFFLDNYKLVEKCVQSGNVLMANHFNDGIYGWKHEIVGDPNNEVIVKNGQLNWTSSTSGAGVTRKSATTSGKFYMLQYDLTQTGGGAFPYHFDIKHSNGNGTYHCYTKQTPNATAHFYQARDTYMQWALRRSGSTGTSASLNLDNVKISEVVESNIESSVSTDVADWSHVTYSTSNPSSVSKSTSGGVLTVNFNTGSLHNGYKQSLSVTNGRYYKITFDLNISSSGKKVNIRYGGNGGMANSYTSSGTYAIGFEATSATEILSIYNNTSGAFSPFNAQLSNIKIEEVFPGVNLYKEEFENEIYGWKPAGTSKVSVVNNELNIKSSGIYNGARKDGIQLDPFTEYKLTFKSKVLTSPSNGSTFKMRVIKDGTNTNFDGGVTSINPNGAQVVFNSNGSYTVRFKTDQNTTAFLYFEKHSSSGTWETWTLEDFKIEKVGGFSTNFTADVLSYSDYYPFGMAMSGRNANAGEYKYGYQGSEKDEELKDGGNSYTTYYRAHDPRLGRWLSLDPVFQPWQSPYNSMDNNPVFYNDVLGDKVKVGKKKEEKEKVEVPKEVREMVKSGNVFDRSNTRVVNSKEIKKAEKKNAKIDRYNAKVRAHNKKIDQKMALFETKGYELGLDEKGYLTADLKEGALKVGSVEDLLYTAIKSKKKYSVLHTDEANSPGILMRKSNQITIHTDVLKNPNKPLVQQVIALDLAFSHGNEGKYRNRHQVIANVFNRPTDNYYHLYVKRNRLYLEYWPSNKDRAKPVKISESLLKR